MKVSGADLLELVDWVCATTGDLTKRFKLDSKSRIVLFNSKLMLHWGISLTFPRLTSP